MSYTGFSTPSIAIINQIQTLLKERYKEGFPVIKEIIQNANDGGASTLHIALVQNLKSKSLNPDISHPLLKRPALVFINNGDFSDKDERAILWFGADLNASDTSKVGKFGLGQKSIFHFCEAFFYLAKSSKEKEYQAFVNPWAKQVDPMNPVWQDIQRPDWEGISSTDRQYLTDYLQAQGLIQADQQFFVLWIPLRQESDRDRWILSNTYPNIDSISHHLSERLDVKVATLLPMLRSLNTVNYWIASDSGRLEKQFSVSQRHDSESSDRDSLEPNIVRSFDGGVNRSDNQDFVQYLGKEIKLENNLVKTIYDSPNWPQRLTEDDKGNPKNTPDKPDSHCSAIISRTKSSAQTGKLLIQWAVFLPVADDERDIAEFEQIDIDSKWDYTFLLHGYFFLDSGRRYIEFLKGVRDGIEEVESPIARQWNEFLVAKGTLPLALSALWNFIENLQIPEEEISLICSAIAQSSLYKSQIFKSGLCLNSAIVYRIHRSGNRWHLVDHRSKPMRSLPTIPSKQIWQTLPQLSKYAEDYFLIDPKKSNLFDSHLWGHWRSQEISQLIDCQLDLNSMSDLDKQEVFNFIVSVLESVSDKKQLILAINKDAQDAQFIKAKVIQQNTSTNYRYLSIRELENAQQEKRIFIDTTYYSQDWATALAEALSDTQIFLVEQRIALILFEETIRECNRSSCLDFLRLKPKLSSLGDRQNLLRKLI
ncbi:MULTISPECIES: sacsin N-terminal ATP-binding-like domain-containing protein [Pseudanabaena]|uniref:Sacsin/Nov domain-containing protein n=2 Tax=Pseudanabaena TaxID=1152 RepID=L8N4R3_9CYAN|nr:MULTISPECIES: hypothetical protein [Pseudanabaena]ELS34124.1 hypothetical protein Pse7429DRAFT_0923 [Pseudanabaena biceps PCC 7429]MDG3493651.1 hypothetical protein [Pseudanabaena catenata USMAC16]